MNCVPYSSAPPDRRADPHTTPATQNDRWHVNERRWGTVSRSVRLPKVRMYTQRYHDDDDESCRPLTTTRPPPNNEQTADAANIAAKYENGVLKVKVGKQAEAARKAIRVE